jgi:Cytochrome c554 and c-prime
MRLPLLALGLFLGLLSLLLLLVVRPSPPAVFHGKVVALDRGIGGARVRVQATGISTLSDPSGRFRLPFQAADQKITAWQEGFFIGGLRADQSLRTISLQPLPVKDHPDYAWVDPGPDPARPQNCANCHAEIYREWEHSAHSRSITGKHFRNLYEGTDFHDRPGVGWGLLTQYDLGAAVCFSCHAPALPDQAPATLNWANPADPVALRGVHCDYCHKITGAGREKMGLSHGRFNLQLLRPPPAGGGQDQKQVFFGPLDDVDRGDDTYSTLFRQSLYCASCHEGTIFGVHVYSTWSEWLASPARQKGQQCQDCHMKSTGRMTNIASGHGGLARPPDTLANHRFFDGTQAEMLRRCIHLSAQWKGGLDKRRLTLRVAVDGVGHRVPTGFPDRHLLLVADGQDASGRSIPIIDGPTLPSSAGPNLVGRPGRLYAKLLQDRDGRSPVPFWQAGPEYTDNRLIPGQPDDLTFSFPSGVSRVRVRLVYRRFWEEVTRKKGWPDSDLIVLDQNVVSPDHE